MCRRPSPCCASILTHRSIDRSRARDTHDDLCAGPRTRHVNGDLCCYSSLSDEQMLTRSLVRCRCQRSTTDLVSVFSSEQREIRVVSCDAPQRKERNASMNVHVKRPIGGRCVTRHRCSATSLPDETCDTATCDRLSGREKRPELSTLLMSCASAESSDFLIMFEVLQSTREKQRERPSLPLLVIGRTRLPE
jgi:hypothetical protein